MTNNDELALKLKAEAEKASGGEWLREAGEGWQAICSDDDQVNGGFIICSFQGNDAESNRKFVQHASPANILALLAERDADKKRIEMLERYVNERDAQNQDLLLNIGSLQQRIDELEARTVSVKLPENTPLAEAPEHIWLQTAGVWPENGEFSELTWCSDNQHRDDTLYVRADLAAGINLEVGDQP